MNRVHNAIAGVVLLAVGPLCSADGGLATLRGEVPLTGTTPADLFRVERDRDPIPRDYVQQPPLIPHGIKGYNVTMNFNKCMDCHSWTRYREAKATKVSLTHFKDRDNQELANISPRRYFCLQCHVPQTDAPELVENRFVPVKGVKDTSGGTP